MSRILASFCGRQQIYTDAKERLLHFILWNQKLLSVGWQSMLFNTFCNISRTVFLTLFWSKMLFLQKVTSTPYRKEIVAGCCIIRTGEIMHNPEITILTKRLELYSRPFDISVYSCCISVLWFFIITQLLFWLIHVYTYDWHLQTI